MASWFQRAAAGIGSRPVALFLLLYAALGLLAWLAALALPDPLQRAVAALTGGAGLGAADPSQFGRAAPPPDVGLWAVALVAMAAGGALALPVAWLFTVTRKKRGFAQSTVQSLILLAVVVSGVVVLVKFSLALAFSLAGIVAAVRFRHTLEDSKDAVYIFAVTGIGLAAGVELSVAATLSVGFSLTTVLLFRSDFGRLPAQLEGQMAEERMRRALAMANRTSQFVARLDREILEQMAPAQLEALADRALERRRDADATSPANEKRAPRVDAVLKVGTDGSTQAREAVEAILGQLAKSWRFRAGNGGTGAQTLEYAVRLRRSVQPALLLETIRRGHAGVTAVELLG